MSRRTYDPDAAQAKRDQLQKDLADGIGTLVTSGQWQRYLEVQSKFHRYSFGNTLLIMLQRPDATRVMGYGSRDKRTGKPVSGWLSLGRQVRAGEQGIKIWAPVTRMADVTDASGNVRYGPDGKPRRREQVVGWRITSVFDITQTDGPDLPDPVKLLEGEDDGQLFEQLSKVAGDFGFSVSQAGLGATNGYTTFSPDEIVINQDRSPRQQVKTLAHELGHAILHRDADYEATRPQCELEAESVAYVVLGYLGVDAGDYSFGYVAHWAGAGPDDAARMQDLIKASGEAIQKAAKKIITTLEGAS